MFSYEKLRPGNDVSSCFIKNPSLTGRGVNTVATEMPVAILGAEMCIAVLGWICTAAAALQVLQFFGTQWM